LINNIKHMTVQNI